MDTIRASEDSVVVKLIKDRDRLLEENAWLRKANIQATALLHICLNAMLEESIEMRIDAINRTHSFLNENPVERGE